MNILKELYVQLFNNSHLVEVSAATETISVILQNNPILSHVPYEYHGSFPLLSSISEWCY